MFEVISVLNFLGHVLGDKFNLSKATSMRRTECISYSWRICCKCWQLIHLQPQTSGQLEPDRNMCISPDGHMDQLWKKNIQL